MGRLNVADRAPLLVAEAAIGAARAVARVVPARLRKRIEDGVFHYIFQKTRVENDAYGWRPPPAGGAPPDTGTPEPETAEDREGPPPRSAGPGSTPSR